MARAQSENYAEIRREILTRTATLFARQGYPNTSIADIAEANGISRGLLYHYFASKEALLGEMLNDHLDTMLDAIRAAASRGDGIEPRFRDAIHTMVSINARSQDLQIVLLHDLHNLAPAQQTAIVRKQRDIVAVIRGLVEALGRGRRLDPSRLTANTMMFIGMINYTYLWYDPKGPVGPEEYADMVADTYLYGVRGVGVSAGRGSRRRPPPER